MRGYQWHCYPLVEVKVIQDEDQGEARYASCAESFFLFALFCLSLGEMVFLGGRGSWKNY